MSNIDKFRGEFSYLSNMYSCDIEVDGVIYPSVENAFCALKCKHLKDREHFVSLSSPDAKKLGKIIGKGKKVTIEGVTYGPIEKVEGYNDTVALENMRKLLDIKFSNPFERIKLDKTGKRKIIEGNTWHDNFYGSCSCDRCTDEIKHNHLGKMLMEIRES